MFFIFLKPEIEKLVPKKQDYLNNKILRDRAGVARWAHNPKVGCSNHSPATKRGKSPETVTFFILPQFKALENKGILRKKSFTFRVK